MATTTQYSDYIKEKLSFLGDVRFRKMMGEYLLYSGGTLFGGLYDNRLLLKKNGLNAVYGLPEELPYPSAKPMYGIDVDNENLLKEVITATVKGEKEKCTK